MLKQVNHQIGSYRYLKHTTDKQGNDGRKTRYEVQELLVAEYETDGSMNLLLAKILELWYIVTKSRVVRPESGI